MVTPLPASASPRPIPPVATHGSLRLPSVDVVVSDERKSQRQAESYPTNASGGRIMQLEPVHRAHGWLLWRDGRVTWPRPPPPQAEAPKTHRATRSRLLA